MKRRKPEVTPFLVEMALLLLERFPDGFTMQEAEDYLVAYYEERNRRNFVSPN